MDKQNFHNRISIKKLPQLLCHLKKMNRSSIALISLSLVLLLAYNSVTIFSLRVPLPAETPTAAKSFLPENVAGKYRKLVSLSPVSSNVMYAFKEESAVTEKNFLLNLSEKMAVEEENPVAEGKGLLTLLRKQQNMGAFTNHSMVYGHKRGRQRKTLGKNLGPEVELKQFSTRVKEFFSPTNSTKSCKFRFFMTWISSFRSFGSRELFAIESLFKWHPNGCLVIISHSLDSERGTDILRPFLNKGFQVTAISPDFNYLFKNTVAQVWFHKLIRGKVDPGEVSLGQNLSNLLRLGLLHKFGGIYVDTDVIILRSIGKLKNTIGAQTIDLETRNWSRLNNAVLIFDKSHPLLYKFIEEFALTFDGNKWGHNGPYLVSRVVSRVSERPGYNITVLPPMAFYPVDWSKIDSLFTGPGNDTHSKWLLAKLGQIRNQSFAVHLWNKQSRKLKVEEGSIIQHLMSDSCIFCNSVDKE